MPFKLIHPTCCEAAVGITLSYDLMALDQCTTREDYLAFIESTSPEWCITLHVMERRPESAFYGPSTRTFKAVTCPACGTRTPAVVRNTRQKRVRIVIDGGYYCEACSQRLIACRCPAPEQYWRVS
jgi:uncharacterized Fe-S center protein